MFLSLHRMMNLNNTFYVTLVMRQKLVRAFLSFGVVLPYFVLPWWKNDIIKKTRNYHVFIIPLCAFQCVFFISTWPAKIINSSKLMSMGVMFIRLKWNNLNYRCILYDAEVWFEFCFILFQEQPVKLELVLQESYYVTRPWSLEWKPFAVLFLSVWFYHYKISLRIGEKMLEFWIKNMQKNTKRYDESD